MTSQVTVASTSRGRLAGWMALLVGNYRPLKGNLRPTRRRIRTAGGLTRWPHPPHYGFFFLRLCRLVGFASASSPRLPPLFYPRPPRAAILFASSKLKISNPDFQSQAGEVTHQSETHTQPHSARRVVGTPSMGDEKAPKAGATDPVVLRMELHCAGCAQKVKKSIKHLAGVESVAADVATNTVVVAGTADAAALKARIEAKTKKPVEIVSAGGGGTAKKPAAAAEPKAVKDDGGDGGEKKGDKDAQAKEEKGKKQPPEEKKPKEETVLLRIRLHCDGCADRIRRRIYKIKGVKEVVMDGNAKDEVKVSGTMDVPAMLTYLTEKLNRAVETVAPGKKDGGGDEKKKDKGGDADGGDKKKDAAGDKKDKGKSIEFAGPSTAAAAASMAPAPAEASTYHVSPYGYGYVAYPQQQGPPPSYYQYYGGGNGDGVGYANPNAGGGGYYHPHPNEVPNHQPPPYPPYPYHLDMSPAPQLFSDENPNACSVM